MRVRDSAITPITGSRKPDARARVTGVGQVSRVNFLAGWPLRVGIAKMLPLQNFRLARKLLSLLKKFIFNQNFARFYFVFNNFRRFPHFHRICTLDMFRPSA